MTGSGFAASARCAAAALAAVAGLGCAIAAASAGTEPIAVELAAGGAWRFAAPPAPTAAALERAWGQFELRLPRQGFPVPAPNCRDMIRLRWVAIPPQAPDRGVRLQARWQTLERLKALQAAPGSGEPVRVPLDLSHYTRRDAQGRAVLLYCNAFVSADP